MKQFDTTYPQRLNTRQTAVGQKVTDKFIKKFDGFIEFYKRYVYLKSLPATIPLLLSK